MRDLITVAVPVLAALGVLVVLVAERHGPTESLAHLDDREDRP